MLVPQRMLEGENQLLKDVLWSPQNMWVPGIELRSADLVASPFTAEPSCEPQTLNLIQMPSPGFSSPFQKEASPPRHAWKPQSHPWKVCFLTHPLPTEQWEAPSISSSLPIYHPAPSHGLICPGWQQQLWLSSLLATPVPPSLYLAPLKTFKWNYDAPSLACVSQWKQFPHLWIKCNLLGIVRALECQTLPST